jgi:hypothetical protein
MQKLITMIGAREGIERATFHRQLLADRAPRLLEGCPALRRYIVNLVDVVPNVGQPVDPRYDAVTEMWFDTPEEYAGCAEEIERSIRALAGVAYTYHVSERIQLDEQAPAAPGQRSPGVKAIYLTRRLEGLSEEEAKRRWKAHAPLAMKHHSGMAKYVQNGVYSAITPGAPVVHGIAELHFPTLADLEQRMYDSAGGRQAIAADVAGLVAESTVLYTSEYVLRR